MARGGGGGGGGGGRHRGGLRSKFVSNFPRVSAEGGTERRDPGTGPGGVLTRRTPSRRPGWLVASSPAFP